MTEAPTRPRAWTRWAYAALWIALVALYVAPPLAHLRSYAWDYDEGPYLQAAALAHNGHRLYDPVVLNKLPFLAWALELGFALGGASLVTARVGVLLLTILGFVSLGLLAELWWGRGAGPAAMAMLLTVPEVAVRAFVVMNDLPAMSLALVALLAATLFRRTGEWGWAAGCAAAYALAVGLHPLLLFLGWPLLWALAYPRPGKPFELKRGLLLAALLGGTGAALLAGTLLLVDWPGFVRWVYDYNTAAAQAVGAWFPAGERIADYGLAHWPLVAGALIGGVLVHRRENQERRFWLALALVWAAMTATALYLYRPLWRHYLLLLLYPLAAVAGGGLVAAIAWLQDAASPAWRRIAAAALLALGMGLAVQRVLAPPQWPAWPAGYTDLVAFLAREVEPGEMVASDNPFAVFAAGHRVPPALADTSFKRIRNGYLSAGDVVGALLRRDVRWVVLDGVDGRFHVYPELLRAVAAVTEPGPCFGQFCTYRVLPPQSLAATLGDNVRLRGYRVAEPGAVRAGTTITVTLYWEQVAPVAAAAEHKVFVHLIDGDGELVAQHDGPPAFGLVRAGEPWPEAAPIIADTHPVALPAELAPGVYTLTVGMYRWPSLERLPAADGEGVRWKDDTIEMMKVRVEP